MAQPARVPAKKPPPEKAPPPEEAEAPQSRVAWLIGWVIVPGLFFSALFLGGVYVGANHHDGYVARAVMWLLGWF